MRAEVSVANDETNSGVDRHYCRDTETLSLDIHRMVGGGAHLPIFSNNAGGVDQIGADQPRLPLISLYNINLSYL